MEHCATIELNIEDCFFFNLYAFVLDIVSDKVGKIIITVECKISHVFSSILPLFILNCCHLNFIDSQPHRNVI